MSVQYCPENILLTEKHKEKIMPIFSKKVLHKEAKIREKENTAIFIAIIFMILVYACIFS